LYARRLGAISTHKEDEAFVSELSRGDSVKVSAKFNGITRIFRIKITERLINVAHV
jgi:hypothetical protein